MVQFALTAVTVEVRNSIRLFRLAVAEGEESCAPAGREHRVEEPVTTPLLHLELRVRATVVETDCRTVAVQQRVAAVGQEVWV